MWRNDPATDKQLAYIMDMQEFSEFQLPPFTGKTKGEACDYISRYVELAHETTRNLEHEDNYGDRI